MVLSSSGSNSIPASAESTNTWRGHLQSFFKFFFLQDENSSKGYFELTLSVKDMDAKPFRKGLQRAKIMTHKVAKERIEENSVPSR